MNERLKRRGPDACGTWSDPVIGAHLGFRRLSILDRSAAGHQPMVSADGGGVLAFNGEIYNHPELRRLVEARGVTMRGTSDTEVLLEWLRWKGVAGLSRLNGMFALAYLDVRSRQLLLARDHAGIKPLYYASEPRGPGVAFSSRYDTLFLTGWLDADNVDDDALSLYLEFAHVPAPRALHRGARQVEPGCYVEVGPHGLSGGGRWWSAPKPDRPDLHGEEAIEAVRDAVGSAVSRQLVADVPVGVFLSSGVDSPLIAANAAERKPGLSAFTMGSDYEGWDSDERPGAHRFADALGLPHHTVDATLDDVRTAVHESMEAAYEPMGDYSLLPMLMVSRLARGSVTVALSGDGGDELFFGYGRPASILGNWPLWRLPTATRRALFRARHLPGVPRIDEAMTSTSPAAAYRFMHSPMATGPRRLIAPALPAVAAPELYPDTVPISRHALASFARRVEFDLQLQRVLKKVDMASMHHSLEVRVPLLDREVIDTSYRVALATHMPDHQRKAVLVELLGRRVPRQTISPVKRGFGAPLSGWLNGPLFELAEGTFTGPDFALSHLLDQAAVVDLWRRHNRGEHRARPLWTLLSLQWWSARVRRLVPHHAAILSSR